MIDSESPQSPHGDGEQLLFGILALQMQFVDQKQLMDAIKAWNQDRSIDLKEILQNQSLLTPQQCDVIKRLQERSVELHDGDLNESLETIQVATFGKKETSDSTHSPVDQTLVLMEHQANATQQRADADPSPKLRFQSLRAHARGGLGEVFVALDKELNRFVALKEIQVEHSEHQDSRARFEQEAEITGGLEHPGIVPVYGKGFYPDGRPYYAMRFIEGLSLREAITAYHGGQGQIEPGTQPSAPNESEDEVSRNSVDPTLGIHKLLGRFIDVCNAIHYAHSRGIIHRDLKPANIMLGRFGETLVVDWGLAKAIGKTESVVEGASEETLRPSTSSHSAPTMLGQALGTPGYMSPEQAAGRHDQLSPASDIYGLGATLYSILTGLPPFQGKDITRLLDRVQQGDFKHPRKVKPTIHKALEAICLKAMANRIEDRYPNARSMADDIERWMADEPVSCYRPGPIKRLQRVGRRHATAVVSATVAVVVALCALAGFSASISFKNQELTEKNSIITRSQAQLELKNLELEKLVNNERRLNQELESSIEGQRQLNDQLLETNEDLESAKKDAIEKKNQAELAESFAQARQLEAETARSEFEFLGDFMVGLFSGSDPIGISELNRLIPSKPPQDLSARDLLREGERRLSTLDATPLTKARIMSSIGSSYRTLGDLDSAERLITQALDIRRQELPEDDLAVAESLYLLGWLKHDAGNYFEAETLYRQSLEIRQTRLEEPDLLVASTMFQLGWLLSDMYRFEEAKEYMGQCLSMRQQLLAPNDRRIGIAWAGIAANKLHAGEEDLQLFNAVLQAIRIFNQFGVSEGAGDTVMTFQSAVLAFRFHQNERAEKLYRDAIEKSSQLLNPNHPWVALGRFDLAMLLVEEERIEEAHEQLTMVAHICDEGLPKFHPKRAIASFEHASVAEQLGKYDIAVKYFGIVVEITEHRLKFQPDDDSVIDQYLLALHRYGDALESLEQIEDARQVKQQRVDFAREKRDGKINLVYALQSQANLEINHQGDLAAAVKCLDEATELMQAIRANDEDEIEWISEECYTFYRLSQAHTQLQNWGSSISAAEQALPGYYRLIPEWPSNGTVKRRASRLELRLIAQYAQVGRLDDAAKMSRQHWERVEALVRPNLESFSETTSLSNEQHAELSGIHRQLAVAASRRAQIASLQEDWEVAIEWQKVQIEQLKLAVIHTDDPDIQEALQDAESQLTEYKAKQSDDHPTESATEDMNG